MEQTTRMAFHNVVTALIELHPDERVKVMTLVNVCYCPKCGYPAPPDNEDCALCAERQISHIEPG